MKDYGARLMLDYRNFAAGVRTSSRMMSNLQKDINRTKRKMRDMEKEKARMKIKADATEFSKTVKSVKQMIKPFKQQIVQTLAARDLATERVRVLKYKLQALNRRVFSPVLKVKDKITGFLSTVKNKLFTLKNTAIVIGVTYVLKKSLDEVAKTQTAQGQVRSLGVDEEGIEILTKKAKEFSNTWSGTARSEFIAASYDIKSGIASLTNQGVADFAEMAGLTAKATKSTIDEMTTLYAQAYGIYRGAFKDDFDFGENFSAGIAKSVQMFRTNGSEMQQYLTTLGPSANAAGAGLGEILAVGGTMQASMAGSEAATKYASFIANAVKAGDDLGLKFTDNNNKLLSSVDIVEKIRKKYGEVLDAVEAQEIKEAFGRKEAADFIKYFYNKTGELRKAQEDVNGAMDGGLTSLKGMARAMNEGLGEKMALLKQRWGNLQYAFGLRVVPGILPYLEKLSDTVLGLQSSKATMDLGDLVGKGIGKALGGIESFIKYIRDNPKAVKEAWDGVVAVFNVVGAVFQGVMVVARPLIGFIKNHPQQVVKFVKAFVAMLLVFNAINAVIGIIIAFMTTFLNIKALVKIIWTLSKGIGKMLLPVIKRFGMLGIRVFKGVLMGAKQLGLIGIRMFKGLLSVIRLFATGAFNVLRMFFTFLAANPVVAIIAGIILVVAGCYLAWKNNWFGMRDILSNVWDGIKEIAGKGVRFVVDGVNDIIEAINKIPGIELPQLEVPKWVEEERQARAKKNETRMTGSQKAVGLPRVPYDNYPAILHEGEMVLTKQDANRYQRMLNAQGAWKVANGGGRAQSYVAKIICDISERKGKRPPLTYAENKNDGGGNGGKKEIKFEKLLDKLADTIVIREKADIDELGREFESRIKRVMINMA